jgi:membrane protease subunit HflK
LFRWTAHIRVRAPDDKATACGAARDFTRNSMPWNDNSKPGPWGAPNANDDRPGSDKGSNRPKSPWGSTPPGGSGPQPKPERPRRPRGPVGRTPPDLAALGQRVREQARRFFRGPDGRLRPGAVAVVAGAAVGLWVLSGVYIVQPDEQAVVTRFGAYVRSEGPGLKVRMPSPLERVEKVSVTSLNRMAIGGGTTADVPEESLMLTGDENIVDMNFSVLWRVSDADNFLFRVSDPEATVKMVAESAMREVVGNTPFQAVVSTGRGRVQGQAQDLMQRILNQYDTGVSVVEVQILAAEPPREVIDAFRDVARAGQNAEASVNEANTYRNRVVNEAVGDASAIRQQAEGYRERVVREAEGEAARFSQVYAQYRLAPGVTRERLYLETMERVLRNSNKVVVDTQGSTNAPIILPPDVFRPRAAAGAAQAQPAPQAAPAAGAAR